MTEKIKLDRADLIVKATEDVLRRLGRIAVYSSVNGHAQAPVAILVAAPPRRSPIK